MSRPSPKNIKSRGWGSSQLHKIIIKQKKVKIGDKNGKGTKYKLQKSIYRIIAQKGNGNYM